MEPRADGHYLCYETHVKRRKEAGEGMKAVPSAVLAFWHRLYVLGAISPHTWGGTCSKENLP